MNKKLELRIPQGARIAFLLLAVSAAGLTQTQVAAAAAPPVAPAPVERTDTADTQEAGATPVNAKPCKKKKRGGLLGAIKNTGLASVLTNSAVGGGLGGYAAGQVASVAVDEGAKAEAKPPSC